MPLPRPWRGVTRKKPFRNPEGLFAFERGRRIDMAVFTGGISCQGPVVPGPVLAVALDPVLDPGVAGYCRVVHSRWDFLQAGSAFPAAPPGGNRTPLPTPWLLPECRSQGLIWYSWFLSPC